MDAARALQSLCPNAEWSLNGSHIIWETDKRNPEKLIAKNLVWHSKNISMPTKDQIENEILRLQEEYKTTTYQRLRKPEYPPLTDLADALYWQSQGDDSKMQEYLLAVQAVKDKYPKGN